MKKVLLLLMAAIILLSSRPLYAEKTGYAVCDMATSRDWYVSAPGKLVRGVTNIVLSWTNIFVQPVKEGFVNGIGKGFGYFFIRLTQGAGDILTFWLPPSSAEAKEACVLLDYQ